MKQFQSIIFGWFALSCPVFWVAAPLMAAPQKDTYPEIEAFAEEIKNVIWDLRGTSSLRHLGYDGETVRNYSPEGTPGGVYESAFIDDGVIRLDFKGPRTAWYFFDENRKWLTSVTTEGEMVFAPADPAAPAKPVKNFPADIQGVVWELQPDERNLPEMKLRWTGKSLELAVNQGGTWATEKIPAVIAERRVLEVELPDGSAMWYVFSRDGREAFMLQVDHVYGGHARKLGPDPETAKAPVPEGMTRQNAELFRHALRLKAEKDAVRTATIRRYLLRRYAAKDAAINNAIKRALE